MAVAAVGEILLRKRREVNVSVVLALERAPKQYKRAKYLALHLNKIGFGAPVALWLQDGLLDLDFIRLAVQSDSDVSQYCKQKKNNNGAHDNKMLVEYQVASSKQSADFL